MTFDTEKRILTPKRGYPIPKTVVLIRINGKYLTNVRPIEFQATAPIIIFRVKQSQQPALKSKSYLRIDSYPNCRQPENLPLAWLVSVTILQGNSSHIL